MIRNCGHCAGSHDTIDDARACARTHGFKRAGSTASVQARLIAAIPVGKHDHAWYALWVGETVEVFQVTREQGRTTAQRQVAGGYEDLVRDGWDALLLIAADPEGAAALYAEHAKRCSMCHTEITRATALTAGRGWRCEKRFHERG
jgi:hypothetical protein